MPATTYSPHTLSLQWRMRSSNLDECPCPTLTGAPRSAHGCTRSQYAVHLCAVLGIRCTGRSRTVLVLPSHYSSRHFPAGGLGSLLVAPTTYSSESTAGPTKRSANLLVVFACRVRDIVWQDHRPSSGSRQCSPC